MSLLTEKCTFQPGNYDAFVHSGYIYENNTKVRTGLEYVLMLTW